MPDTKVRCAGGSDPGRVRRNNEDAFYMDPARGFFLVVDGIGGQAAGEKAAEIAVERVRARLERQTGGAEQRIREAIAVANNEILRAAGSKPEWEGMACVLTLAVIENGAAVIGHVGDSRLYQIRGGEIRKITHDHSPVGEREDAGELTEAEAMRHPRRNEVFRDVGSEEHAPDDKGFIELVRIPFPPDSALVLCSDGLSDLAPSAVIRQIVERNAGEPDATVRELIAAANSAGGKDNVTAVVVEGEAFRAPARAAAGSVLRAWHSRRAVWFAYGVLLAAAGAWLSRGVWVPPPPAPPAPRVLAVGPGAPYSSIGGALAAAKAGDTVEVLTGEYAEQVRLKSGVNLRSGDAILRPAPLSDGPVLTAENVSHARVTGFRVLASPQAPLAAGILLSNSEVELEDVEVSGAGIAIEIRGAANPVLRGVSVHDSRETGILITGPSRPWLSHNLLRTNKLGLAARDGARPALTGNVFEKSPVELPPGVSMEDVRAHNIFLDAAKPQKSKQPAAGIQQ